MTDHRSGAVYSAVGINWKGTIRSNSNLGLKSSVINTKSNEICARKSPIAQNEPQRKEQKLKVGLLTGVLPHKPQRLGYKSPFVRSILDPEDENT
jgi:hypothetical protein